MLPKKARDKAKQKGMKTKKTYNVKNVKQKTSMKHQIVTQSFVTSAKDFSILSKTAGITKIVQTTTQINHCYQIKKPSMLQMHPDL